MSRQSGKLRQVKAPSTAVSVSALAHVAAIGLLLALRPVPYPDPAPTVVAVEVSIEPEQPSGSRPNALSGNTPPERPADASAMQFPLSEPDGCRCDRSAVRWAGKCRSGPCVRLTRAANFKFPPAFSRTRSAWRHARLSDGRRLKPRSVKGPTSPVSTVRVRGPRSSGSRGKVAEGRIRIE